LTLGLDVMAQLQSLATGSPTKREPGVVARLLNPTRISPDSPTGSPKALRPIRTTAPAARRAAARSRSPEQHGTHSPAPLHTGAAPLPASPLRLAAHHAPSRSAPASPVKAHRYPPASRDASCEPLPSSPEPPSSAAGGTSRDISEEYDVVVFLGDLNYRCAPELASTARFRP
jgi:hypothetical protein